MRASGSAVGLLQLLKELLDARGLGHDAVERIREAIIADVAGARPRSQTQADFEKRVRERMDHLLPLGPEAEAPVSHRSEEHTSELQSLMRNSYAVFCLTKKIAVNSSLQRMIDRE